MNIGVFDSGLGGLSIFREFLKDLPEYNYVYLGDNARLPYGGRSAELIYEFTKSAVDFLFKKDCSLIILACNTATSNALRRIQQEYLPAHYPDRRVLGVIRPVVEVAAETHLKKIGVMGTRATINSHSYVAEFNKLNPEITVFQEASPLLVPIIEEGELEWEGLQLALKKYLSPLQNDGIEGLILACTHYALIEEKIAGVLGPSVKIISQSQATTAKLKDYFKSHPEIESNLAKNGQRTFYATDLNQRYEELTKFFLGEYFTPQDKLQLVHL